jgi:hypothetical protein
MEHHKLNNQAKPPTTNKNLIKIKNETEQVINLTNGDTHT